MARRQRAAARRRGKPRNAAGGIEAWRRRLRSVAFRRRLRALLDVELHHLATRRWRDVVDVAAVRRRIRSWSTELRDREAIADLLVAESRATERRWRSEQRSLLELLGDAAGDVEAFLDVVVAVQPDLEPLAEKLVGQELVRRLLTDLIFTAIDAFYRRINPLFGAMTTRMLEDQIKAFIGFFMPTLQRQAVAFVSQRANQRMAQELLRAVGRDLLRQPLAQLAELLPAAQRREAEAVFRHAVRSRRFDASLRRAATAAWDDLSSRLGDRSIGQIVAVERLAPWLAEVGVDALDAALARPDIARFLADEIALALEPVRSRRDGE